MQSAKAEFESGFAPVNGLRMYYEIHGRGEPLVLIHGGGSHSGTTFGRILPLLSQSFRMIAVDMQAHGRTADIDRTLSFSQDADDIARLLSFLNLEAASVFGFSNGASTALHFALQHPRMTRKIVVASTFFDKSGAPDWFWEMMRNPSFEGMPKPYKEAFLEVNPDTSALYRMYERDVARMQAFTGLSENKIKSIACPVLIMAGDRDVVTPEHALKMHRLITRSRLMILPGGHGGYLGEIASPYDANVVAGTAAHIAAFLKED